MAVKHLIFILILASFVPYAPAEAAKCPVKVKLPYKIKTENSVYYVTPNCTKRVFLNISDFFAYFSSWSEVKVISPSVLKKIPNDKNGPISIEQPKKVELIKKIETKPIEITNNTPLNSTPINKTPELNGVIAEYLTCPNENERAQLDQDFSIQWSADWNPFPYSCNQRTTDPSRLSLYSTLKLIKNIHFSKPLPFTRGASLYDFLTQKKLTLRPLQSCALPSGGLNYQINLNGSFVHTHPILSNSPNCEADFTPAADLIDGFVYNPIYRVSILVHEAHHAITGSTHTGTQGNDLDISENSAWTAQFYFYAWVNLYSDNVDETTKTLAKNQANDILNSRFMNNKCPTDADLKKVVNLMSPRTCT